MILPGNVLKEARRRAGLTQQDLAERLNVSQPVVARLESARSNPRLDSLQKAIAATGHAIEVELRPSAWPPIDESLIVAARMTSPSRRLRDFESSYRGARSIAAAAQRGRDS